MSRFYTRFTPAEPDACWPWHGTHKGNGYGVICVNGVKQYAHRVAWQLHHGKQLRPGDHVLHHCDNPICVNPGHLFVGTHRENILDMQRKGRGHLNKAKRFTETDIHQIRVRLRQGDLQKQIAADYGVAQSAISHINTGKFWAHIPQSVEA